MRVRRSVQICLFVAAISVGGALSLPVQTVADATSGPLVLRADARTVVVDVVVTGKSGKPVKGLSKEDFQVEEDTDDPAVLFAAFTRPSGRRQRSRSYGACMEREELVAIMPDGSKEAGSLQKTVVKGSNCVS